MPNIINADNGLVSGSVGLKYSCDNTGVLALQTSGNTAMTIDGSGNVGIGTTTPGRILDIQSSLPSAQILATTGTNRTWLRAVNTSGNFYFGIDSSTGGVFGTAYARVLYGDGAYPMTFYTNATERMRIDSSGNVGIGGTPTYNLDVFATSPAFRLKTTAATTGFIIDQNNSSSLVSLINYDNADMRFGTNNAERMRIDSSGNVGIGTSSPAQSWTGGTARTMQLRGPSATITVLRINEAGGTYGDLQLVSSVSAEVGIYNFSNGAMRFGTNSAERMRIDSSGNVGIGTSSPSGRFSVQWSANDAASGVYVRNTNSNSIAYGGIYFGNDTSSTDAFIGTLSSTNTAYGGARSFLIGSNSSAPVAFMTAGTEKMRITSGGDLLVGCTSFPGAGTTTTGGVLGASGSFSVFRSAATPAFIGRSNDGEVMALYSGATQRGQVSISGATTTYGSFSDYRLKENITPINGGLAKVMKLKPSTFNFIEFPEQTINGFIAHEVAEVEPIAVTGEKDGVDADNKPAYQSVDPAKLVALLTAAIQEQQAMIEELKQEVALLKSKE